MDAGNTQDDQMWSSNFFAYHGLQSRNRQSSSSIILTVVSLEKMKNNNILLKRDLAHVDYKSMRTIVGELEKRGFKILKNYYTESHLPVWKYIEKNRSAVYPFT
jgi:hypothetical protein